MNKTIACALRWGVALVGVFSIGRGSPYMGNISGTGQTPEDGAYTSHNCEESQIMALIVIL